MVDVLDPPDDNEPERDEPEGDEGPIEGEMVPYVGDEGGGTMPVDEIKRRIDSFLEARNYLIEKIIPMLVKGVDFHEITVKGKTKKSLGKPGAEKIANIYGFKAAFHLDMDTIGLLPERKEWVAYVCTLTRNGVFCGEGRGAYTLEGAENDPNKMMKMAQKSAHIDAVIRATGISDLFTQDLEDMKQEPPRGRAAAPSASAPRQAVKAPPTDSGKFPVIEPVAGPTTATRQRFELLHSDLLRWEEGNPEPATGVLAAKAMEWLMFEEGGRKTRYDENGVRRVVERIEAEIRARQARGDVQGEGLPF